jgi:hypothetical protein
VCPPAVLEAALSENRWVRNRLWFTLHRRPEFLVRQDINHGQQFPHPDGRLRADAYPVPRAVYVEIDVLVQIA